ncbi:transposase [Streptomyces sp. NPDC019890]|uniref:transposase n=1 Tax=Streptomyces sp. NPDC019890 TaxID=3365064 RepID=UPI00384ACAA1
MICPAVYACSRTPTAAIVDSQSLWAAADTVGRDGGKKVAGRKGQVVDCLGLLLVVLVTAASVQDRDAAMPLLREHHRRITLEWADGGYADGNQASGRDIIGARRVQQETSRQPRASSNSRSR